MKDGEFERAKSFTAQTRGFRERGKENKPNASVAHTEEEIKLLYDKELFCLTSSLRPLTTQFDQQDHFSLSGMQRLTGLFFSYLFLLSPGNLWITIEFSSFEASEILRPLFDAFGGLRMFYPAYWRIVNS